MAVFTGISELTPTLNEGTTPKALHLDLPSQVSISASSTTPTPTDRTAQPSSITPTASDASPNSALTARCPSFGMLTAATASVLLGSSSVAIVRLFQAALSTFSMELIFVSLATRVSFSFLRLKMECVYAS